MTYQPPRPDAAAVELMSFARLRKLNDHLTQRGDFHVLAVVETGKGRVTVDFATHQLSPRTVVWISPGAVHRWDDIAEVDGHIALFVPTAVVTETTRRIVASPDIAPLWEVASGTWPYVEAALAHLLLEAGAPRNDVLTELPKILLSALIARLCPPRMTPVDTDGTFESFRQAVEASFRMHRDVGYYAHELGYASRTLTRAVQRATGATAKRYIVERVVLEAKRLLAHDHLPSARVAAELGFPDASNFSLFFRAAVGMPPRAWQAAAG